MIPSNASAEEFIKYYYDVASKEQIQDFIHSMDEELKETEEWNEKLRSEYDKQEEQIYFRQELLETIMELVEQKGSKKDLVKAIKMAAENSYVEF